MGFGLLWVVSVVGRWIFRKDAMGFGDVKLLAMLGAFLGWTSIFPIIFLGSILGTAVGIPLMLGNKAGRKLAIPFGPFLAGGALIYVYFISFWYPRMHWYGEIFKDFWVTLFS
jgi:leader peptidase (prepilin peptidase)/N-methyltransferase